MIHLHMLVIIGDMSQSISVHIRTTARIAFELAGNVMGEFLCHALAISPLDVAGNGWGACMCE